MKRFILVFTLALMVMYGIPGSSCAQEKAEYVLKLGSIIPALTNWGQELRTTANRIEKETNGRVRLVPYLGGVLGDELDTARKMRMGQIQIAYVTLSSLNSVCPELALVDLPYMFETRDEAVYTLRQLFDRFNEKAMEKGVIIPLVHDVGWWDFYTNKPVRSLSDLQKMRIEAIATPVYTETFKAWNIPMLTYPPADHVANMERGVADGATEPLQFHIGGQLFTVGPHAYKAHWFYQQATWGLNKKFFDTMPNDLRATVLRILWEHGARVSLSTRKSDDELWPMLTNKTYKMTVAEPSPAELKKFKEKSRPVWDCLIAKGCYSKAMLDETVKIVEEYRKKGSPPIDWGKMKTDMPKSLVKYGAS